MNLSKARFFSLFFSLILALNAYSAPNRAIVYVSNADSHEISVLELDEKSGELKSIEVVPVAGSVMPLAISPDHRFLFAALRSAPFSVSSFAIDAKSGRLSPIKTSPLADNMAYISTDQSGHWLFGASYSGDKISVNAINARGEVGEIPLSIIPTGRNAHSILTDPSNRFLYSANLGSDVILQFRFNAKTGQIVPHVPPFVETKKGAGPRHLVFARSRRFAFGTNELDGTVNTYRLNKNGTLTLFSSVSALPPGSTLKPWTSDLHLMPDNRFLFAAERTSNTIAAFAVNRRTGTLTPLGHTPTETQPRGFNLDPQGKYLIAVGQKSNGLSVYAINRKTGALRLISQRAVGQNPNWVEVVALAD